MASHIATEEWQSFEVRMRRRRAERLVVRAEAALENGFMEDAASALDEARRLCPSLPSIDAVQGRIASVTEKAQHSAGRRRLGRSIAVAAVLVIVASSGAVGWRVMRAPRPVVQARPSTPSAAMATPVANTPAPVPVRSAPSAETGSSIRIETQQVPPVVISGATKEQEAARPALMPARTEAASATTAPPPPTHAVDSPSTIGTTGTPAPATRPLPSPAGDVDAIAALGTEQAVPAPPTDRYARLRDVANSTPEPAPAAPDTHADVVPVATPPVTIPAPTKADDAALVRGILDRYADAYTRLDADAAKAVWPTVNRAALSRAFNGLSEQRIAFNDCSVDVRSTEARATCSGSTTWEPKIGGGSRTDVRRWAFDLQKNGDAWVIRDARVQNR